jgi:small-conductance mechanosensitive channel
MRLRRTIQRIDLPGRPSLPAVTADFRSAVVLGLTALAFLVLASRGQLDHYSDSLAVNHQLHYPRHTQVARVVGTVGFALSGVFAVRRAAREIMRLAAPRLGLGHASVIRWVLTVAGYILIGFTVLSLVYVKVGSLLLGGAVTGIVVGIAAQQALGNLFAGVVLLLSHPFTVGDHIRLRAGGLAGEIHGRVTGMGLTYVSLLTEEGQLSVPNALVLAAAAGPHPGPDPVPLTE